MNKSLYDYLGYKKKKQIITNINDTKLNKKPASLFNKKMSYNVLWSSSSSTVPFKSTHRKFMGFKDTPMY